MLAYIRRLSLLLCASALLISPTNAAAQVIHTNHDHIPDFSVNPTIHSAVAGVWSNPTTWTPARVPGPNDVVRLRHAVTYDSLTGDVDVIGVEANGLLRFAPQQSTRLAVGTLIVLPGGALEVGTQTTPIAAGRTAEIIIKDRALDSAFDPDQYGTGLLVVNGKVSIHGTVKSPTWTRLASEPRAGDTTLVLQERVTGWAVNDVIVVPDSREDPTRNTDAQVERRTISQISLDGRSITLTEPLSFAHPGARDLAGDLVFLPHVMNLSRNVVIRSANPAGTRGHSMYTHRSTVDIRFTEYRDMGRTTIAPLDNATNHIGRYPMHLHHLIGPARTATPANGFQFTVLGNSVYDNGTARSRIKWPIAIHNSHYGLVQLNTIYNAGGAGLVTEDGSESYNVIEQNIVVRTIGEGDRRGVKSNGAHEAGSQGAAFWFRGPNNYVRNNVAANAIESTAEAAYGFEYFQEYLGNIKIPNFKGADTAVSGESTTRSGYAVPILEFSGNEGYALPQGLTYWWLGIEFHTPMATTPSVFKDLRLWHISRYPVYAYQGNKVVFDGIRVYGRPEPSADCCNLVWFGDYFTVDATIRRSTFVGIEAVVLPYMATGVTTLEDSFLATEQGVVNRMSWATGCDGCTLPARRQIIRNVRFAGLPGRPLRAITMSNPRQDVNMSGKTIDETFVYDYQGIAGNQFRAYYVEQASQNIAGGVAPCTDRTTRPEVSGITCGLSGTAPPPTSSGPSVGTPGNVRIVPQP